MEPITLSDLCINTPRLSISPFRQTQAASLCALSCEAENRRCLPDEVCETQEDASRAIAAFTKNLADRVYPLLYAITLHNGTLIGHIEIVSLGNAYEIGYHIGQNDTGLGYATEAVTAFIPVMMRLLRITYLYGICEDSNIASKRVLEHVGFSLLEVRDGLFLQKAAKIDRYFVTASMMGVDASSNLPQLPHAFLDQPGCVIRPVQDADIERIRSIYAPYIEHTNVSFETVVPSALDFTARVENIRARYPYFVFEENGVVRGYAYASRFAQRQAYRFSAELSVYCETDCRHHGVGPALYRVLLPSLAQMGFYTAYSGITVPNPDSVALHRAFCFSEAGCFEKAGYKNGSWLDVLWLQRSLRPYSVPSETAQPIL